MKIKTLQRPSTFIIPLLVISLVFILSPKAFAADTKEKPSWTHLAKGQPYVPPKQKDKDCG